MELSRRDLEVPTTEVGSDDAEFEDFTEELYRAYVYWTPYERWAVGLEGEYEHFEQDDPPDDEINDIPTE